MKTTRDEVVEYMKETYKYRIIVAGGRDLIVGNTLCDKRTLMKNIKHSFLDTYGLSRECIVIIDNAGEYSEEELMRIKARFKSYFIVY